MLTRTAREAVALKVSSKQQTTIMPNVQKRLIKHCLGIPKRAREKVGASCSRGRGPQGQFAANLISVDNVRNTFDFAIYPVWGP